jgi:hypothetical protein
MILKSFAFFIFYFSGLIVPASDGHGAFKATRNSGEKKNEVISE